MKGIIFLAILFFLISCGISKTAVEGSYSFGNKMYSYYSIINLKPDSTFTFDADIGDIGLSQIYSNGEWTIKNRNVILNSNIQSKSNFINVMELKDTSIVGVCIKAYDQIKKPFPINFLFDTDSAAFRSSSYSYSFFEKNFKKIKKIHSIAIAYDKLKGGPIIYKVKDTTANLFIIKLEVSTDKDYRFFINKRLRITKQGLIDYASHDFRSSRKIIYNKLN